MVIKVVVIGFKVESEGVEPVNKVQKLDVNQSDIHDNSNHDTSHDNTTDNHDNTDQQTNVNPEVVPQVNKPAIIVSSHSDSTNIPPSTSTTTTMAEQKSTDDEKLKEYLSRTNTVVIYPEPVSDGEDGDNDDDDEDRGNTSHDLENCFGLDEDIVLKCAHCDLTFSRFNVLRDHMRDIHPDLPVKYLCPKCDEAFLLKSHLDKHLAMHSPTSQSCNICNKTFANVYRLQRHMISHDESTDLRKFKCPECGKAFKFKHHLKEHIRIHSGEKPFQCPNCSKRFSHSGSYSSHMTSKKCWVMNQSRPCQPSAEATSSAMRPGISTTVHSYPHPMMHFDPLKPGIPAYYSPAGARFLPMYPVSHHAIRPVMTSLLPQSLAIPQSTAPPAAHFVMATKQISPDVNSNTKVVTTESNTVKQEPVVEKKETSSTPTPAPQPAVLETYKCKFCCEIFTSAVQCHQHERYICKKDEVTTSSNASSDESKTNQSTSSEAATSDEKSETLSCRFCDEVFSSPVSLHQHERYICKLNKDVVTRISDGSPRNSPSSSMSDHSHILSTASGSPETESEDQDDKDDNALNDSKKFRMRSLISDEQLHVLKSYYSINPRPRKYELIRIGNEIGFPKRVVQVWFQNMRARDRRRGKEVPYFPSMARFKRDSPSHSFSDSRSSTPAILPVAAHGGSKKVSNTTSGSTEQPLDLSTKPAPAHSNSSSPASSVTPPVSSTSRDEVLNLSVKPETSHPTSKPNLEHATKLLSDSLKDSMYMKTPPHKYPMDGKLQSSAIYKYMQQEGLFPGYFLGNPVVTSAPSMMHPTPVHGHTKIIPTCEPAIITSSHPMYHPYSRPDTNNITISLQQKVHLAISKIHQARSAPKHDDDDSQSDSSCSSDSYQDNHRPQYNGVHFDAAMEHATHNLATLAEVSLADRANLSVDHDIKLKRMRKKSWRQMESEEIQLDLDDALLDEDHPYRKKRRSWKNHRMEADDGLYGCDQCKKMFSKQSSLARHKYEHSGARPFNCEICHKAFKHKHHLTEHRRLHSGEKPFQCKKCGKRFSHSGSYSQHMNHRYKYCKPTREEFNCTI